MNMNSYSEKQLKPSNNKNIYLHMYLNNPEQPKSQTKSKYI